MTQLEHFHTTLPFDRAVERLNNGRVQGVKITVKPVDSDMVNFRLDLRKRSPLGIMLTTAHLIGTIRQVNDGNLHVSYQTHPLSRYSVGMVLTIGIAMTVLLLNLLPLEFAPIAGMPGIAGVLFALFWNMLNSDIGKEDRFRLQELIARILEKQSSMATWQA